jgi:hypothetical protein
MPFFVHAIFARKQPDGKKLLTTKIFFTMEKSIGHKNIEIRKNSRQEESHG